MRAGCSKPDSRFFRDGVHILVAPSREIDQQDPVLWQRPRQLRGVGERVRGLERRNDALEAAQVVERGDGLSVVDGDVLSPAGVLEPGVLGAHTRVIKPRRDRMRLYDLAVFVLKQIGAISMQHPRPASAQRGRMFAAGYAESARLHADELTAS